MKKGDKFYAVVDNQLQTVVFVEEWIAPGASKVSWTMRNNSLPLFERKFSCPEGYYTAKSPKEAWQNELKQKLENLSHIQKQQIELESKKRLTQNEIENIEKTISSL